MSRAPRPPRRALAPARLRLVAAVPLLALLFLSAACLSPSPSGGASPPAQGTGAQANPLACIPATSAGKFPSPPTGTVVTIDQIAQAVGHPVRDAELDSPATTIFGGFEACQYTFSISGLSQTENVTLVEGTNPLDAKTATDEFADTEQLEVPLSDRDCTANSCNFHFVTFPGLGEAAVKGSGSEGEVIAARQGSIYLEIGPGNLNQTEMVNLAQTVLSSVT
ncbi:MAG: hypothetical protein ACRDJU_15485 [Actinomycetota bacterium]